MGKQWQQWKISFSWAPKSLWMVTAAMKLKEACSLEEKLWPTRQHIKKQRHYFANKGPLSQSYGFPVVTYGCQIWTIKKAERQRINASEPWCWRRLLRVPWTTRRSNQSILKEIKPENSLEGLNLKLKLQYFGHQFQTATHWKRPWCWERLKAGGERDDRGWDGWMASPSQWTCVWASSGRWGKTGKPGVLLSMGSQSRTRLSNWTTTTTTTVSVLVLTGIWAVSSFRK